MSRPVRVRFAPSPTGYLHVGGLRTALYNFLFARKHDGTFVLRIEDTDQTRYVEGAEEDILRALEWAGLPYDEGPGRGGAYGPYRQSDRLDRYRAYADLLLAEDRAYVAFDTPEALQKMKASLQSDGNPSPKYDARTRHRMQNSLTISDAEVRSRMAAGEPYVIRLKVPADETVRFEDLIRGWVAIDTEEIDDQVLIKSDGFPTYHLANVVDDHLMEISHVIRGEEWLPSTPKHLLMYRFLGWEEPRMAHLPLILSPTGGKLSKRNAEKEGIPVFVQDYRTAGFEAEALVNFLAFLGWNPGDERELFSLGELAEAFELGRVGSSGVQFNLDKLHWYNQQYLRQEDPRALADRARPYLEAAGLSPDEETLVRAAAVMQERLDRITDLATEARYLFEDPASYDLDDEAGGWTADAHALIATLLEAVENTDAPLTHDTIGPLFKQVTKAHGVKMGALMRPVRLALSGVHKGPGMYDMIELLGKETVARRLRNALRILSSQPERA